MAAREDVEEYDYILKLVVLGDLGVGKTSLVYQYTDHTFSESHTTTIGIDFIETTIEVDGKKCKLLIWDTAGQERFRAVTSTLYRGTHGVILVYDAQKISTFENIPKWLQEIANHRDDVPKILVGNKSDEPKMKEVSTRDARKFSKQVVIPLFETSAKANTNVEQIQRREFQNAGPFIWSMEEEFPSQINEKIFLLWAANQTPTNGVLAHLENPFQVAQSNGPEPGQAARFATLVIYYTGVFSTGNGDVGRT
ncbi:ras-related protein Rab-35-like [Watersipora subatra]|uniref:ras-related protein Rab-35-like n=1 Tax=Watersipora subatra TaxID=2589382 RepID=UPI00355C2F3D